MAPQSRIHHGVKHILYSWATSVASVYKLRRDRLDVVMIFAMIWTCLLYTLFFCNADFFCNNCFSPVPI